MTPSRQTSGDFLAGLDLARLILALHRNPPLTIPAFLGKEEVFYKVTIPNSPNFELPRRYPWMMEGAPDETPVSWEISFTRSGLPLHLKPSNRAVGAAELSWIQSSRSNARYLTRDNVTGRGDGARLTDTGKALMRLLTFPD